MNTAVWNLEVCFRNKVFLLLESDLVYDSVD